MGCGTERLAPIIPEIRHEPPQVAIDARTSRLRRAPESPYQVCERYPGERRERAEDAIMVGAAEPVELFLASPVFLCHALQLRLQGGVFGRHFGKIRLQLFQQIFECRKFFVHVTSLA